MTVVFSLRPFLFDPGTLVPFGGSHSKKMLGFLESRDLVALRFPQMESIARGSFALFWWGSPPFQPFQDTFLFGDRTQHWLAPKQCFLGYFRDGKWLGRDSKEILGGFWKAELRSSFYWSTSGWGVCWWFPKRIWSCFWVHLGSFWNGWGFYISLLGLGASIILPTFRMGSNEKEPGPWNWQWRAHFSECSSILSFELIKMKQTRELLSGSCVFSCFLSEIIQSQCI